MVFTAITYGVPTMMPSYDIHGCIRSLVVIQQFTAAAGAETAVYFPGGTIAQVTQYSDQLQQFLGDKLIKIRLMLTTDILAAPISFYGTMNQTPTTVLAYTARQTYVDNDQIPLEMVDGPYRVNWASFSNMIQAFLIVQCTALTATDSFYLQAFFEVIE